MESQDERQQEEITALKSIYADDFLDSPPPKAWKGAVRQPEFIITVRHPEAQHASRVLFHLLVKFPKTYPAKAPPIFTVQRPTGISPDLITQLSNAVHNEALGNQGSEMVLQIVMFCQDWIASHVKVPIENPGASLASEMKKRAQEEEEAKKQQAEAMQNQETMRAAQISAQLREQIREDTIKKEELQRLEKERHRARRRAFSDATVQPTDAQTESFDEPIGAFGIQFDTVKLYHPQQQFLGTHYSAEAICDDAKIPIPPLSLFTIVFDSQYYTSHQGRKKLRHVQSEIQRLCGVRHENVLRVLAVSLRLPETSGPVRLSVLLEQRPSLSLRDILDNCDTVREGRASDYLGQILSGLHAIHSADLVHRGLTAGAVGLVPRSDTGKAHLVKLCDVAFYTKLQDLHKSDPFGSHAQSNQNGLLPDAWLPRDAIEEPLVYTRSRDIHAAGVILLQMSLGLNVTQIYADARSALQAANLSSSMERQAMNMVLASKKNPTSCLSLLGKMAESSLRSAPRSAPISFQGAPNTPIAKSFTSSPEKDYFRPPPTQMRQVSRWKEDWEELELLGRGGFGSVLKARNKLDNRVYAVKKVKLRATQSNTKIFREVNALSRLSHRFIVRYYTTWLETVEQTSNAASSGSGSESDDDDAKTSVPHSSHSIEDSFDPFSINLDDLALERTSSFPSIHFSGGVDGDDEDDDSTDGISSLFDPKRHEVVRGGSVTPPTASERTLYIQMEFVENQTLKERISEGLSEDEAWRLFQQITDALVHMSSLGILHRDIKLTNIFIDAVGDCKVGDFGLATSSLAAVDPSDVSHNALTENDMTLEVGTKLYIAPEVLARGGGPRNHNKADMYSLGVVFFEMNFAFTTGAERIAVLENVRRPEISFPDSWDTKRIQQKSIISWLLQHNPNDRPTALELSQSPLLPPRLEDEYFKGALRMMAHPDSPHYQAVLSSLFNQPPKPVRGLLYDLQMPEHASLNGIVQDRLTEIFRLHGAVDMEPPLLMPQTTVGSNEQRQAFLLDRHGEVIVLPSNALVPFARLAARTSTSRIKRFHIGDTYRDTAIGGHPKISKAAVFDIVTPDMLKGPEVAIAELVSIMGEILDAFPNLGQNFDIHISHSKVAEIAMNRVPKELRASVTDVLSQTKSSSSQKRASLLKQGLLRSTADELEVLSELYDDLDMLLLRIEKVSSSLWSLIRPMFAEVKSTCELVALTGVTRPLFFQPLMLGKHHGYFKDGVCFEVVRRHKITDILAAGGRYDHLISHFSPPTAKADNVCAMGMQIALERITASLAAFQSVSVTNLVKEQRSFGYWSARRCDVYIVSFQPGHLHERLEVAALLWQHNISADVMYETGVADADLESVAELCGREGILFTVYPRPRGTRRELSAFKVKSVLRGTEYEVARQELVGWLQQAIAEQKRIDLGTTGVSTVSDSSQSAPIPKENSSALDVQLLLAGDAKKQRKLTKQLLYDKAYEMASRVKSAMQTGGLPLIAVDVSTTTFESLTKNDSWVTDDEAWRPIAAGFPTPHAAYANIVREAVAKRKEDGCKFVLLFAVREERVALLAFS
ncbi:Serine/threonine-protein kinase [Rickenella mellea]|uniref:non-specific serine/threonine protein kinase n=1 Tax=Rickenella mellea TaxID=50990 RepID=A0A4Y7PNR4_9AGAM|nr:Serine/threonine-protein kinase [Rickenella mellea]